MANACEKLTIFRCGVRGDGRLCTYGRYGLGGVCQFYDGGICRNDDAKSQARQAARKRY